MICQEIRELLSPYLDNVLSSEEKAAVDFHLARCLVCRQELHSLQEVSQLVQGLEEIEPPEDFRFHLHQRLVELQAQKQVGGKFRWFNRYQRVGWLSAAVAAACLVIGLSWGGLFADSTNREKVAFDPYAQTGQNLASSDSEATNQGTIVDQGVAKPEPGDVNQTGVKPADGRNNEQGNTNGLTTEVNPLPPKPSLQGTNLDGWSETRIIKEAVIKVQPANEAAIAQQLQKLAVSCNGDISGPNKNDGNEPWAIFRVPQKRFEQVMSSLSQLGKIVDSKVTETNVTNDYDSTYSRLEKLKLEEWKLLQNSNLANNPQLQSELTRVQGDIKNTENHLEYLDRASSFVTIKIYLTVSN
ncbi:MAG: DUF4349 domain-containing protein [Firmicutes bacterium]|nr:DUF4349 domain-containing protein [Bacillota bacterium]